jgi:hypothetical protein
MLRSSAMMEGAHFTRIEHSFVLLLTFAIGCQQKWVSASLFSFLGWPVPGLSRVNGCERVRQQCLGAFTGLFNGENRDRIPLGI